MAGDLVGSIIRVDRLSLNTHHTWVLLPRNMQPTCCMTCSACIHLPPHRTAQGCVCVCVCGGEHDWHPPIPPSPMPNPPVVDIPVRGVHRVTKTPLRREPGAVLSALGLARVPKRPHHALPAQQHCHRRHHHRCCCPTTRFGPRETRREGRSGGSDRVGCRKTKTRWNRQTHKKHRRSTNGDHCGWPPWLANHGTYGSNTCSGWVWASGGVRAWLDFVASIG